ncbi:choice-of-anchor P family protein [Thermasporomyces composti]|nr:choice-of-anchor P family protein [Thermasporomyces composti]
MHPTTFLRRGVAAIAAGAAAAAALVATTPAQAQPAQVGYAAQAYGTYAFTSDRSLVSGPTAYTEMACGTKPGLVFRNHTADVKVKGLGTIGATVTEVRSIESGNLRSSLATSETAKANLLGGAITVDGITSSTKVTWDGTQFRTEQSATLADLQILGVRIPLRPKPNTKIELKLPGLGTVGAVELNKQYQKNSGTEFEAITTALVVSLLPNNPWLPKAGTTLRVGNSKAVITKPMSGYFKGQGFATRINALDGMLSSGPTALAKVRCLGGETTNSIAALDIDGLLEGGAARTHAVGVTKGSVSTSRVVNDTAKLDLLDGAITVEALRAVAQAQRTGNGPVQLSTEGTKFVGLKVQGQPVLDADVAPNTKIDLGIAQVTLNKVRKTATTVEVTMVEVVVQDDILGLPTGSKIEIGRAYAGINPQ